MKYIVPIFLLISFSASVIAAQGGGHNKLTEYDYHDYTNSSIQSKTFIRYDYGVASDFVWTFDRSNPGVVLRTEIITDANNIITRYSQSKFTPTTESFNLAQVLRYSLSTTPPILIETIDYTPAVDKLTNAMIPGIAWGSTGEINSSSSGVSYYNEKSEVVAVEDVTVPAGTYNSCLKIHRTSQYGASIYTRMDWFCPDMGLVKRVNNGRILLELNSVTYN